MLDAFRKWMFGRVPSPKYGGVYVPTVLPGEAANMAAQAAAATAFNFNYEQEKILRKPQQSDALKRKLAQDEADRLRRRRSEESSPSSDIGTSLAIDTALNSAWSSSDSSSSWSSDSSSSGSDFSGGGGSFGGGGSDGSW